MIRRSLPILALVGAICGLAFVATPAIASEWHCTPKTPKEECRYKLQGKGQQIFKLGEKQPSFECRKLRQEGQFKGPSLDLQSVPKFETCFTVIAGLKHNVKVVLKECEYRLTINKGEKGPKGSRLN